MVRRKRRALHELPVRACRWGERCLVCLGRIDAGEQYHAGRLWGCHLLCAQDVAAGRKREPTRAELRELQEAESETSRAKGNLYVVGEEEGPQSRRTLQVMAELTVARMKVRRLKATWAQPERWSAKLPPEGASHG